MNKIAVDTNILLYALDDFYPEKQNISIQNIADKPLFCSQSLSEFTNVCLRRWRLPKTHVAELIKTYLTQLDYIPISEKMILHSVGIMKEYDLQLFDSMIIACALDSNCSILYFEYMQDGLMIEKSLQVINPFKT